MRVLIDLTYLTDESYSGVANYAYRLLKGFKDYKDIDFYLLTSGKAKNFNKQNENVYNVLCLDMSLPITQKLSWFNHLFFKRRLVKIIKNYKIDILFSPYYHSKSLRSSIIPHIGVIHDMQPFVLEKGLKAKYLKYWYGSMIKKLSHIIAISNSTKIAIQRILNIKDDKIEIIYNSIDKPTFNNIKNDVSIKNHIPYILYVNTLEEYKNIITLIKAFNVIKDLIPHNIVIKGKRTLYFDNKIIPLINSFGINDRIELVEEKYSNEEMSSLYTNADVFVSPSTMEGFGYTPIEAAIHGCPIICSNIPSLYESTLGLAFYYGNPTDYRSLAKVISKVLSSNNSDRVRNIAEEYINTYSIKKQVSLIINLFEQLIK